MVTVLGIDVDEALLARWRDWFAPAVQPFRVADLPEPVVAELPDAEARDLSPEVRDTFRVYSRGWRLIDAQQFAALSASARRALTATRPRELRPVRWPVDLARRGDHPVLRYVAAGVPPTRHREVPERVWEAARAALPRARELAGTFPEGSGPNCFGTVLAGAGVAGADRDWVLQAPFERWLSAATKPVGRGHDDEPGVVLLWRNGDGVAEHAAVTLGDGWAFLKPSQAWSSPRVVWDVRSAINQGKWRGTRLERHRIV